MHCDSAEDKIAVCSPIVAYYSVHATTVRAPPILENDGDNDRGRHLQTTFNNGRKTNQKRIPQSIMPRDLKVHPIVTGRTTRLNFQQEIKYVLPTIYQDIE